MIDIRLQNNIFANSVWAAYFNTNASPSSYDVEVERNLYFNNPRHWYSEGGPTRSLSQMQAVGKDLNSLNADPMFVNPGVGDFHLQASSPARNLGVDILDLNGNGSTIDVIPAGAYVTGTEIIGSTLSLLPPGPQPMSAPRNLRVIPN